MVSKLEKKLINFSKEKYENKIEKSLTRLWSFVLFPPVFGAWWLLGIDLFAQYTQGEGYELSPDMIAKQMPLYLGFSLVGGALNYMFNPKNVAKWWFEVKGDMFSIPGVLFKNQTFCEKALEAYKEHLKIKQTPRVYGCIGDVLTKLNRQEEATHYYCRKIDRIHNPGIIHGGPEAPILFRYIAELISESPERIRPIIYEYVLPNKELSFEQNLRTAIGLYPKKVEKSLKYIKKAQKQNPDSLDASILEALILSGQDKQEKSDEIFMDNINKIVEEGEENFVEIGDSRNEVLEYSSPYFIRETLVFKRGGPSLIKDFLGNTLVFDSLKPFSKPGVYRVPHSITLFKRDGKFYHILRRRPLRNLEQAMLEEDIIHNPEPIYATFSNLALIHGATALKIKENNGVLSNNGFKTKITRQDPLERIQERLGNRLGVNDRLTKLLEEYERISGKFPIQIDKEVLSNGDPSLPNTLEDGTTIDFENACFVSVPHDLTGILVDPRLSEISRFTNNLLDHYVNEHEKIMDSLKSKSFIEKEDFGSKMELYFLFHNLCQIGSYISKGKIDLSVQYFNNALELSEEMDSSLHNAILDYVGHSERAEIFI